MTDTPGCLCTPAGRSPCGGNGSHQARARSASRLHRLLICCLMLCAIENDLYTNVSHKPYAFLEKKLRLCYTFVMCAVRSVNKLLWGVIFSC